LWHFLGVSSFGFFGIGPLGHVHSGHRRELVGADVIACTERSRVSVDVLRDAADRIVGLAADGGRGA